MTNPTQTETVEDGWWKVTPPIGFHEDVDWEHVIGGRLDYGDGATVEYCLRCGYTFEPAVVMTTAEHSAMQQQIAELRQQLEAQAGWETLDKLDDVDRKPNVISRAQFRGLIATEWRLQRRKAGEAK